MLFPLKNSSEFLLTRLAKQPFLIKSKIKPFIQPPLPTKPEPSFKSFDTPDTFSYKLRNIKFGIGKQRKKMEM